MRSTWTVDRSKWGGFKQRALLALLLLEANRVVPRDGLIDALWEDDPPATAQKALQVYVSQLRGLLGRERVETRTPGYLLRVDEHELDLARFRRLRGAGRPEEALSLWRGPPLAEFAQQRFAQPEIARLGELHVACLEERRTASSPPDATPSSRASWRRSCDRPAARAPARAADALPLPLRPPGGRAGGLPRGAQRARGRARHRARARAPRAPPGDPRAGPGARPRARADARAGRAAQRRPVRRARP